MTKRKKKGSGATAAIVIIVIAVLIAAAVVFALAFRNETNSPSDPDDTAGTSDVVVNDSNDTAGNENSANVVGTADSQTTDTTDEVTEDVTPDEHIEITDITVNENFKYSNGGTVSLSIQAPKLVSETYGENADVFNSLISTEVENLKNEYAKAIATDDTSESAGENVSDLEYTMSYEVKKSSDAVVSVLLSIYSYTGGPHGATVYKAVNFDMNSAMSIDMQYVTGVPAEEYTSFIKANILEKMKKEADGTYFSTEDGALDGVFNDKQFFITESGITVFFQEYDIAPYSMGLQMFEIPYNELIELSSY